MPWLYNGRGSNREIGATNDGWFPRTAGRPGWVAPPAGSLHHHSTLHTHTFTKHCPVLHAHFIHSIILSQPTTVWHELKIYWWVSMRILITVCISILNNEIKPTISVLIYFQSLQRLIGGEIFTNWNFIKFLGRVSTLKLIYPRKMSNFLLQIDSTKRDSWLQFCRQVAVANLG